MVRLGGPGDSIVEETAVGGGKEGKEKAEVKLP